MKILFLTDNFPPESNAPATRTYEHCRRWIEKGVEVTVITCFPNFPQGKIYNGYKQRFKSEENIDGIRVIRVWTYVSANKGFTKRILDYLSFGIMSFIVGRKEKADILIATSPQFFTAVAGHWLSRFTKMKYWVMEVRDLWPESIAAVGSMKKTSAAYRWLERLELKLYRSANQIITVTHSFKKNIIQRGIDGAKIHVVENGVNDKIYTPRAKNNALLNQLQLQSKFIVAYIGTHGLAHALDFVVQSAAVVQEEEIHFLLIGNGAEKSNLIQLAQGLNLKNITLLDSIPKEKIPQYISIIDVALVNLKKSDTFKTVIPSKIFENAAMGKPILLGVEGESKKIIEKYQAGIAFEPENQIAFLQAITSIYTDRAAYKTYVLGAKALAKDYNRNVLADRMLEKIWH